MKRNSKFHSNELQSHLIVDFNYNYFVIKSSIALNRSSAKSFIAELKNTIALFSALKSHYEE
jgi:hypothetical protein